MTCSLPFNTANTELVVAHTSSGAEELARKVPRARIVSAFNTIPSEVLFPVFETRGRGTRPSLVYCGDDAGALRIARYAEPLAALMGELAYRGKGGRELAYRFERYRG